MILRLLSLTAVLALTACSSAPTTNTVAADATPAVQENDYPTGSNIARRKSNTAVATMTTEQAEEMRRAAQIRSPQSGAGGK